jgi:hypothetical protein
LELSEEGPGIGGDNPSYAGVRRSLSLAVPGTTRGVTGWLAGGPLALMVMTGATGASRMRAL